MSVFPQASPAISEASPVCSVVTARTGAQQVVCGHVRRKLHSGARACRRGSLEIIIRPENGRLSSKIRKIAHDADSAKRDRQVKTVTFKSENRLKLANMMTIQSTKMTRNGVGIALPDSANRMRRVCTKSVLTCAARACSERWRSFCGDSA